MKKLYFLNYIIVMAVNVFFLASASQANWQKSDENYNAQQTQLTSYTQHTQHTSPDSLPAGVTKEWLNKLTDEKGNRIIQEGDPEGDALQQKTFDGVVAGDEYGRSVSSAGDVNGDGFDDVIIGAARNNAGGIASGRAYIYLGGTVIDNSVDVILTGGATNNYFGTSVSSAGDVNSDGFDDVIVGAPGYNTFTGRSCIYYGGASMNSIADVIMTGESTSDDFGRSVSGAGDVNNDGFSDVIVGANASNVYTGKAYIYYGGTSMNNIADVIMTGGSSNDNFGYSVSGAGDVNGDGYRDVICGAYGFNGSGRTYIYFGGSAMDNTVDVSMFGGGLVDFFGASVSNAGDVNDDGYSDVIVGAYGYNSSTGRAYIFYGGSTMNNAADVTMTGEASNNAFGYSVSDAGDVNGDGFADVYVGAYGYAASKGRAYLYYGGASMNNVVDIYMTGDTTLNYFGYSVAAGGDVNGDGFSDMIAGAYGKNSNTGRAYVYTNTMTGEDIPDVVLSGGAGDYFGFSVSDAGDVNGDGFDDVIVGEDLYDTQRGRAYIFFGGLIMDNVADVIMTGEASGDYFAWSVSGAGDLNGDGYDDVIVGAHHYNTWKGRVYIYFGGASMDNSADLTITGTSNYSCFGYIVSEAGNVNGDGYDDVIISANCGGGGLEKCYIYYGSASMDNSADVILSGGQGFGATLSSAGDINGDGYDDVIVNAFNINTASIFFGGIIMDNIADVTLSAPFINEGFAHSVSSAGDFNGDGYSDVIVGSDYVIKAYIFFGGVMMDTTPDVTLSDGSFCISSGDVNDDNYSDLIIGGSGRAYVYFGGSSINATADIVMSDGVANSRFGYSVSSAGDINNDGFTDVIVGAPNSGKAYIYLSSPPNNRKNLLLFGAIQGMYDPITDTEIPDTIKVYLRNSISPFARVDSSKNILLGPGTGQQFLFRNAQNGIPYFIEVTHRNALTTWSADPVTFINSDASVAFSVDAIYAYGNNEIQVDNNPYNVFAFYSGDVNQNGNVDASDLSRVDNDAFNFVSGYIQTDVTGNNITDANDLAIVDNNAFNFVSKMTPP